MYTTLLVPFDGSDFSARALSVAADLAERTRATIHVAMVNDPSAYIPFVPGEVSVPVYDSTTVRDRRAADQQALDEAVAGLTSRGLRAIGVLLDGMVVESLVEYGQQAACALTVMTTHGRSGFARMRLGSVANAYLSRSTTPVLLIRGSEEPTAPTLPTGTLLCPLDGSPFAESILPHAALFADACGLTMRLVSVVTPHAVSMAPFATEALLADPSVLEQEEQDRQHYVERIAKECPPGTQAECVSDMSVGRAILDASTRNNVGAIAIATHGRSGIARMVLGSVADELIRHCELPTLVYRPEATK